MLDSDEQIFRWGQSAGTSLKLVVNLTPGGNLQTGLYRNKSHGLEHQNHQTQYPKDRGKLAQAGGERATAGGLPPSRALS